MEPTFEIKVEQNNIKEILRLMNKNVEKALEECGMAAETFASRELTEQLRKSPKSWYKRTGVLRNSITHEVDADKKQMIIGDTAEYAVYVELGTGIYYPGGRKTPWGYVGSDGEVHFTRGMPPRPFIKPSLSKHLDKYEEILKANL